MFGAIAKGMAGAAGGMGSAAGAFGGGRHKSLGDAVPSLKDELMKRMGGSPEPMQKSAVMPGRGIGPDLGTGIKPQPPGNAIGQLIGRRGNTNPPPTMPNSVPPRWDRWNMAQNMISGYQNQWNPNPVLMQLLGRR